MIDSSRFKKPYDENLYVARVVRWLDGDTVELDVDLGQKTSRRDHYRLARLQAWETTLGRLGATAEDVAKGKALKERLAAEFPVGSEFIVTTAKAEKYGRFLIELFYLQKNPTNKGWNNLNDRLLAEGVPGIGKDGGKI